MKGGWVYIMTNRPNGTLYTGVTADLAARVTQHREGRGSSFCRQHGLVRLVYAERHDEIEAAILREKRIKERSGSGRSAGGTDENRSPTMMSSNCSAAVIFGSFAASVGLALANQSAGSLKWLSTSMIRTASSYVFQIELNRLRFHKQTRQSPAIQR